MNNEEKILEMLTKMQTQQEQMQVQLGEVQTQQEQMQAQLGEVQTQLGEVQAQQKQMETRLDRMEKRQDKAQDDIQWVRLYLELDVEKRFDGINEGIDAIQEKLVPMERVEKAEDDIVTLKVAVKALARDVAELKKAQ